MTDAVTITPVPTPAPDTLISSADKILQIGKDLSSAIGVHADNPADVLNKVKSIAGDAKATLGELKGNIDNKHFDAVATQVEKLDKMLENNKLTGADVKAAAKTITSLTVDVTKLAADIATGNVVGITVDSATVFKDALATVGMLKVAAHKFHEYYKGHLKPVLKAMAHKVVAVEHEIKSDIGKAIHWVGDKIHHKDKAADAAHHDAPIMVEHAGELIPISAFEPLNH